MSLVERRSNAVLYDGVLRHLIEWLTKPEQNIFIIEPTKPNYNFTTIPNHPPQTQTKDIAPPLQKNDDHHQQQQKNDIIICHLNLHRINDPAIELPSLLNPDNGKLILTFLRSDFIFIPDNFRCVTPEGRQSLYQVEKRYNENNKDDERSVHVLRASDDDDGIIPDYSYRRDETALFSMGYLANLFEDKGLDLEGVFSFEDMVGMFPYLFSSIKKGELELSQLFAAMIFQPRQRLVKQPQQRQKREHWMMTGVLPDAVEFEIIDFADVRDLLVFRLVSKSWRNMANGVKIRDTTTCFRDKKNESGYAWCLREWCEDYLSVASIDLFLKVRRMGYDPMMSRLRFMRKPNWNIYRKMTSAIDHI